MSGSIAYARRRTQSMAASAVDSAERRLNFYLWCLLAVTNVVDVLGTQRAFDLGIGELNPIVELFYGMFGMASVVLLKALFLTVLFFMIPYIRGWNRVLFVFACCVYLVLTVAHVAYLSPLL